jgi:hypothetical protein
MRIGAAEIQRKHDLTPKTAWFIAHKRCEPNQSQQRFV